MMLNVVDVFSRKAWIEPLPDGFANTVWKAFQRILKRSGGTPTRLHVDQGTEFEGVFAERCKKTGIALTTGLAGKPHGQAIVERANFTIEELFTRGVTVRGKRAKGWWDERIWRKVGKSYASLPHNSLGRRSPDEVHPPAGNKVMWREMYEAALAKAGKRGQNTEQGEGKSEFKVGDRVRLANNVKRKNPLSKGALPNWSSELYLVTKVVKPGKRGFLSTYRVRPEDAGSNQQERLPGYYAGSDLLRVHDVQKGAYVAKDEADEEADAATRKKAAEARDQTRAEARETAAVRASSALAQQVSDAMKAHPKGMRVFVPVQWGPLATLRKGKLANVTGPFGKATLQAARREVRKDKKGGGPVIGYELKFPDGALAWHPKTLVDKWIAYPTTLTQKLGGVVVEAEDGDEGVVGKKPEFRAAATGKKAEGGTGWFLPITYKKTGKKVFWLPDKQVWEF
jgi:hypothetical protein